MSDATFLDALVDALDTARRATGGGGYAPPAALLWPDEQRDWEPLVPVVAGRLPVLTLAEYDSDRRGPSYWVRCVIDGSIAVDWLDAAAPIVYMPGYGRAHLRAIEEAPDEIQPLAELQYRGAVFSQVNGKDWTLPAFLQASTYGGLGIEVAADNATKSAIRQARVQLASVRVTQLRAATPLKAGFFNQLLAPDLQRLILEWLDDPAAFREGCSDAEWSAFREQFRQMYRLDLVENGPVQVAEYLGHRPDDAWDRVWRRFAEAPSLYGHVPERLRAARPAVPKNGEGLFDRLDSWPQVNDEEEIRLRAELTALANVRPPAARLRIEELELHHRGRRSWVWAKLGRASLAVALGHLADLGRATAHLPVGESADAMAADYAASGWRADDAAMRAIGAVSTAEDVAAVGAAVASVYGAWLDDAARAFQALATSYMPAAPPDWPSGTCVVYSDGLRYDIGKRLEAALVDRGLSVKLTERLTALPTVTSTAKPFVTAVGATFASGPGFDPSVAGSRVTLDVLRRQLHAAGYQVLGPGGSGDPSGLGWTEIGDVDSLGHDQTPKLPRLIDAEVAAVAERIGSLLAAGWSRIAVVTDHGWLYLPGGLPKVELPQHLTLGGRNRKARCGRLDSGAVTPLQTVPWTWDVTVSIAIPPGSAAFEAGQVYEHGGLSLQECVTPVLVVTAKTQASGVAGDVSIAVRWRGLRAVVTVTGAPAGASLDLRRKAGDGSTSELPGPTTLESDGSARLLVEDEDLEGASVFIVVLDLTRTVIAHRMVEVGADS